MDVVVPGRAMLRLRVPGARPTHLYGNGLGFHRNGGATMSRFKHFEEHPDFIKATDTGYLYRCTSVGGPDSCTGSPAKKRATVLLDRPIFEKGRIALCADCMGVI